MPTVIDCAGNIRSSDHMLSIVKPFPRLRSYFLLRLAFVSVPDAIMIIPDSGVNDWSSECDRLLQEKNWSAALVRRDCDTLSRHKPRGGFVFDRAGILTETASALDDGFAVILHPAYSRYNNEYAGNVIFGDTDYYHIEFVGRGFDVSDLNRGDNLPHERWKVWRKMYEIEWEPTTRWIQEMSRIRDEDYQMSWRLRVDKASRELGTGGVSKTIDQLATNGFSFLKMSMNSYSPLRFPQIADLLKQVNQFEALASLFVDVHSPFTISFSKPVGHALFFWDIFSPSMWGDARSTGSS